MKFDPRINPEKIGSYFRGGNNDNYIIGEFGYFCSFLDAFKDLKKCDFGKFWGIDSASEMCFMAKFENDSVARYRYFYPIREMVTQYRAYTPAAVPDWPIFAVESDGHGRRGTGGNNRRYLWIQGNPK